MSVFSQVEQYDGYLGQLLRRRAQVFESDCKRIGLKPSEARLVVMWGGGKDSTVALILAKAISCLVGCSVSATTMVHPGLSEGTIANIEHMVARLELVHEWRLFTKVVPDPFVADRPWLSLYHLLALATEGHPRFMCVGCNLGSVVVELSALADSEADFLVTGNPARELRAFDAWASALKQRFSASIEFPQRLNVPMLDYYRLWWAVYDELLRELDGFEKQDMAESSEKVRNEDYLYELPSESHVVASVETLSVLEDLENEYVQDMYYELLKTLGWRLPGDIQGGTESDCMMPAAIATLDIRRNGLANYIEHLNETARVLRPLPEMYDRAIAWANNGRSVIEGDRLLGLIGISDLPSATAGKGTPVAMALVNQLLPVR